MSAPKTLECPSPLAWPTGWARTSFRNYSKFKCTFTAARDELSAELDRLGARDVVLSSNLDLRLDGQPRSNCPQPGDPGIAVYFDLPKKHGLEAGRRVLACDRWSLVAHNVRAIARHVEAIRGMERWGVGSIAQAFAGYRALPAPGAKPPAQPWRFVLGVPWGPGETYTEPDLQERFRELARRLHPDAGGTASEFQELVRARDDALEELKRYEP